jgi:hypothetical protein
MPEAPALVVFAQATDAGVDVDAWNAHATRFFATGIGLAELRPDVVAEGAPARTLGVRFVIAPKSGSPGIRAASARPRSDGDLALAAQGEARSGTAGLLLLAQRCATVWLVARESEDDPLALRLATILASIHLGPILDPVVPSLIGVKTARALFER